MERTRSTILAVLVSGAVALAACGDDSSAVVTTVPSAATTAATTTGSPASTAATTAAAPVTTAAPTTARPATTAAPVLDTSIRTVDFRNGFSYKVDDYPAVTVKDGGAEIGKVPDPDYFSFYVGEVVYGDFDGDAREEAAVLTEYNTGGTGRFTSAWIYRKTATGTTLVTKSPTGDRALGGVGDLRVDATTLVIDNYADDQGACCPTAITSHRYKLTGSTLSETGTATKKALVDLAATPVTIKFLTGTAGALLRTYAETKTAGSFAAAANQKLVVTPRETPAGLNLALRQGSATGAIVSQGTSLNVTLPAAGTYVIEVSSTPPAPAQVLLDMSIT
ncbi:MAG: hypothetical protein AB7L13_20405 [Acidimicrobiia bacterium]